MSAHNMQLVSRRGVDLSVFSRRPMGSVSEPHNIPKQCEDHVEEDEQRHPRHLDSSVDTLTHVAERIRKKEKRNVLACMMQKRSSEIHVIENTSYSEPEQIVVVRNGVNSGIRIGIGHK